MGFSLRFNIGPILAIHRLAAGSNVNVALGVNPTGGAPWLSVLRKETYA
ncbi:hypothetical protein [Mesorhizobium sp.]|nr:hypothetical protein [Mesorhizobium sp.]